MYQLTVTYADHEHDRFAPLGSIDFHRKTAWRTEYDQIPTATDKKTPFVLDQVGRNGEIVADKLIDPATAADLLGRPAADLSAEGAENLAIEHAKVLLAQ